MMAPPYQKPETGPTPQEVQDAASWSQLVKTSTDSVIKSAEKWRDGLAALVSLITGGLIIAGPDGSDMSGAWRYPATLLVIAGLACAGIGFLMALTVAAGRPGLQELPSVKVEYGSVENYLTIRAAAKAKTLKNIEKLAAAALGLLILGGGAWMAAPKAEPDTTPQVTVTSRGEKYCGKLLSGDQRTVRIQVDGEKGPRTFPYVVITNLAVGAKC